MSLPTVLVGVVGGLQFSLLNILIFPLPHAIRKKVVKGLLESWIVSRVVVSLIDSALIRSRSQVRAPDIFSQDSRYVSSTWL